MTRHIPVNRELRWPSPGLSTPGSSALAGQLGQRAVPVRHELFPFFLTHGHVGALCGLVPPSPQRELGPQWPPLQSVDRLPRPSRTGSDTSAVRPAPSLRAPPGSGVSSSLMSYPYRKSMPISFVVVSFSTTRKLGWRFLIAPRCRPAGSQSQCPRLRSPQLASPSRHPHRRAEVLSDRRVSPSPAFAAHRLFGRTPRFRHAHLCHSRLLGHAH